MYSCCQDGPFRIAADHHSALATLIVIVQNEGLPAAWIDANTKASQFFVIVDPAFCFGLQVFNLTVGDPKLGPRRVRVVLCIGCLFASGHVFGCPE